MKIRKIIILLIFISIVFTTAGYAAEANFSASLLTASDVEYRKCHTDTRTLSMLKSPWNASIATVIIKSYKIISQSLCNVTETSGIKKRVFFHIFRRQKIAG